MRVEDDVLQSGYWIEVCDQIETAWDFCRLDSEDRSINKPDFDITTCADGETVDDLCEDLWEELCRNSILGYYAESYNMSAVY